MDRIRDVVAYSRIILVNTFNMMMDLEGCQKVYFHHRHNGYAPMQYGLRIFGLGGRVFVRRCNYAETQIGGTIGTVLQQYLQRIPGLYMYIRLITQGHQRECGLTCCRTLF